MTHTPPIPTANQAPYPPIASANSAKAEKTDMVAKMKANAASQSAANVAAPTAILIAAVAAAGAVGYILWAGRARSAAHD